MSYVDQNLTPGEQVIHRAKLHWAIFLGSGVTLLIGLWLIAQGTNLRGLGGLVVLIALLQALGAGITYATTEFAVTNKRVIGKRDLINRQSLEVLLTKVESISVDQSIVGRLLGYGTIVVAGSGGTRSRFPSIADPLVLRQQINNQISSVTP